MICQACKTDNPPEARFCGNCGGALVLGDKPPSVVKTLSPAGFWIRFGAFLVDFFFIWIISAIVLTIPMLTTDFPFKYEMTSFSLSFYLLIWLYFWLFTGLKGQTPGKMLVGIKVLNRDGQVPGLRRAALREIVGKLLSALALFIGFLSMAWDEQKRGWHDKLAGTYVVSSRK